MLWSNWQVFGEDKLTSKEVEGVLGLLALTCIRLAVKLARAVAESFLFTPAMINQFRDSNVSRNWS